MWVASARGGAAKIAPTGVHISRWVTTHGFALNVDLDPAPFTEWITACGLEDAAFTSMSQELGRPVATAEVRTVAADAVAEVFGLAFENPLGEERALWPPLLRTALSATLE